ncbi:MAG: RHS repeat-associated core domain-containing protein, partial [Clostridia bacterium]|nr:RHS repeat-associated core domain-containing protein [Clostridia bacterium]
SQIILSNGTTLSYGYDAEERITSVVETYTVDETPVTNTTIYTYDVLGQLLTETVNGEVVNSMEYDNYGNIIEKNGKDYSYGNATWKDLLTGFDGKTIEYDAQGNPVKYLGHTLTWEKGRQLKKFDNIEYTYNAKGIRTSKTVEGVKHTYILDGTKILCETWDDNTLIPIHDNENSVCGIIYNDAPYYFIKNLQGDVIAIVNKNAETVARYSYDAWGVPNITSDSSDCRIATINPFRYRGYFYDEETKLYYLLSRYYNPALGRFINADSIEWLGTNERIIETNIFAYCKNDCVNLSDEVGFGGIDTLLSVLNSSIDILAKIIDMIGNSHNKECEALENSVKLLTKKQSRQLSNIKSLQKETGKLSKRLGWIGYGITFLTLVIGFAASYSTGRNLATSLIELGIETFIALIEFGAGKLFEWIARFIPYVGFLIGLIAGWLISYLLSKFFDSRRVARITSKFKASVKNIKISLGNWVKYAVKSLNA